MSQDQIEQIKAALARIEHAISGDVEMGQRGIAQRLTDLERKIEDHDKKLVLWAGVVTGIAFIVAHFKDKLF